MNQPVLARQQAQQTEQLTGHAHGGVMIGASAIRDADFEQLLQREAFKPNDMLDDGDTLDKMLRVAEQMATGRCTVPKHLQGSVGDCLAIVTQAMQWDMNPFAVAQKTHVVNGTLGYEAQLVHAVLMKSGAIRSSFHYEYREEGHEVSCRVGAVLRGEKDITWGEWLSSGSVQTKNSPLWKTNKPQQMGYLQVKNWGRKYAPGAILGVYTVDELENNNDDYTPPAQTARTGPQRKSAGNPPPPPAGKREDAPDPETGEVAPPATRAPTPPASGPTGRISENQAKYLRNKLKDAGASEQETCTRYGVERLEDLTVDAFDERRAELLAG